jgi:hypothetical protein
MRGSIRRQSQPLDTAFMKYLAKRPVPLPPEITPVGMITLRVALLIPISSSSELPQMLFAASAKLPSGVSAAQAKPRQSSALSR